MITEDQIVDIAYAAAEKMYNVNYSSMRSLSIDKDDFMQDAVLYILDLYNKDYMKLDITEKAPGMVMKMLGRFVLNLFQTKSKKDRRIGPSLDIINDEFSEPKLNTIKDKDGITPEQYTSNEYLKEYGAAYGLKILNSIVDDFNTLEYKSTKHSYVGNEKTLGKNFKLSEYNIGKLLLLGYTTSGILKVYDVYTNNIGTSSKATYVNRKVKDVVNKLADIINNLPEDENDAVKYYLKTIQK